MSTSKAHTPQMETLPNELRRVILSHLPLADLKSIRLTSKSYSILGQDYLLSPTFLTLPHRPSTHHLQSISTHPSYAHRIQTLHFNHGEINEYSGRHNSYFLQYLMDPEERLTQQYRTWEAYAHFKDLTDTHLPTSCSEPTLTSIFSLLPNLTTIKITLMLCPFPKSSPNVPDLLANIWIFPSTRLLPRVATVERMTAIMNAISVNTTSGSLEITTLAHDRLPFEFFVQKPSKMSLIASAFSNLHTLHLALEYSDLPNNTHFETAFQNLARCMRAAPLLRDLELAFQGRRKIDVTPLLGDFEADGFVFERLERVQFQGMICTAEDLAAFLIRQKRTLMSVMLGGEGVRAVRQPANGGIYLDSGSWKGLIGVLSEELEVGKGGGCVIWLQGDLKGLESGEVWVFEKAVEAKEAIGMDRWEGDLEEEGVVDVPIEEGDVPWPV